jgi:ABC-2 type transport system permease protein
MRPTSLSADAPDVGPDKETGTRGDRETRSDPGLPVSRSPCLLVFAPSRFRKYWRILRVSLTERLTYRADFFLTTTLRFLPMVTTILLWEAIFTGSGENQLGGFSRHEMIAYLLLVHISRMFSSMPGLAFGIARDIRDGTLKKYLLQPIDMIAYLVSYRVAHKMAYIATSALPYGLLFLACSKYFHGFPDALTLLAYFVALLLGFAIGFFFEACIGMVGFWFLEVTSFLYVVNTVNFFISGQMLPLDILPPFWATLLKGLPFQYLAYFQAAVFLGKIQGWDLVWGLLAELGWAVLFIVLARVLYRLGLRRYSAYGG